MLLAVMVTATCATDRDAGQTLLAQLRERHWRIALVWADGGYTGRWSTSPATPCASR
ncbi:hypothetical protein [Streptomyces caniferus]|uniref:hypothetical protein n=1 Tax=Streptomyces caniferus TaxID=285557 RepID=UPI0035309060